MLLVQLQVSYPRPGVELGAEELGLRFAPNQDVIRLGKKSLYPQVWYKQFRSLEVSARKFLAKWSHFHPSLEWLVGKGKALINPAALGSVQDGIGEYEDRFRALQEDFLLELAPIREQQFREVTVQLLKIRGGVISASTREQFDVAFDRLVATAAGRFGFRVHYSPLQGGSFENVALGQAADQVAVVEALRASREAYEREMEQVRKDVTEAIRGAILEKFRHVKRVLDESPRDGWGRPRALTGRVLKTLQEACEIALKSNPWGDPDVEGWLRSFRDNWGHTPPAEARYLSEELAATIDSAIQHIGPLVEAAASEAQDFADPGALLGRRRIL